MFNSYMAKRERRLWKVKLNDPDSGGQVNSFVTNPAMEASLICLSKEGEKPVLEVNLVSLSEEESQFKLQADDVMQVVTGPLLIPNKWIPRKDQLTGKIYEAKITEEEILKYIFNFSLDPSKNFKTNLEHSIDITGDKYSVPRLLESWWVINPLVDKSYALGAGPYPAYTYMASYYIPDRKLYDIIKMKGMGYSVEAYFDEVPFQEENTIINNNKMKLEKLMSFFKLGKSKSIKLIDYILNDNTTIFSIDENTYVCSIKDEVAPDGEYVLNDGTIITVQNGVVVAITEQVTTVLSNDDAIIINETNMENTNTNIEDVKLTDVINTDTDIVNNDENVQPTELEILKTQLADLNTKFTALQTEKDELDKVATPMKLANEELSKEVERLKLKPQAPATNMAPAVQLTALELGKLTFAQRIAYNQAEYERKLGVQ